MNNISIEGKVRIEAFKMPKLAFLVQRLSSFLGLNRFSTYLASLFGTLKWDTGFVSNGTPTVAFAVFSGLAGNTGSQNAFTYLATGTSNTAFASSQTALQSEITDSGLQRAAATVSRTTTTNTNDTLQLVKTFSVTGTKTVEEVGVFNASSSGVMGGRSLTGTKSFVSGDSYTVTYRIKFA